MMKYIEERTRDANKRKREIIFPKSSRYTRQRLQRTQADSPIQHHPRRSAAAQLSHPSHRRRIVIIHLPLHTQRAYFAPRTCAVPNPPGRPRTYTTAPHAHAARDSAPRAAVRLVVPDCCGREGAAAGPGAPEAAARTDGELGACASSPPDWRGRRG